MMRLVIALLLSVLYISSVTCVKWEDCGIPLTRKIYYQNVVLSPSSINIASASADSSISVNINSQIKDYKLQPNTTVNLEVIKDSQTYFDGPVGDLCQILNNANGVTCPLAAGQYSFTYQYDLPPLPTGNYTVVITTFDDSGAQIGCLSVQTFVMGLGGNQCSYTSSLSADFVGTAQYLKNNTVIQVGPWGPNGLDLGYDWGTFKSISASSDLVGYGFKPDNYVWGLTGSINTSVTLNRFDGTIVIGYRSDINDNQQAKLVYQGTFSWIMTPSNDPMSPPYTFQSGTFDFVPTYYFPTDFPYPLNLGNLGELKITTGQQGLTFAVTSERKWCRCNCALGGTGEDGLGAKKDDSGMSSFEKGTIAVCVVGGVVLVALVFIIIRIRRSKPAPVVYDDADLMDPQKPDYGSMAINDALEEQDYA